MYTFFERIPLEHRYTDMMDQDDDDLLNFWKQTWREAGWEPRVLTREDTKRHPDYDAFVQELINLKLDPFNELQFLKPLVIAASGGGWISDYDVFPVRDFREEGFQLPNKGQITFHDILSPSLASGTAEEWLKTAKAMLADAQQNVGTTTTSSTTLNYWTDTLSILNLQRKANFTLHSSRYVLPSNKGFSTETLESEQCHKRPLRGKKAVHFCPRCMLEGILQPELRLPRHRVTVARDWLLQWQQLCGPIKVKEKAQQ
jgi:hypothetical protein